MTNQKRSVLSFIAIIALAFVSIFLLLRNKTLRIQNHSQGLQLMEQQAWRDSLSRNDISGLLSDVLQKIEAELDTHPERKLSDDAIDRIAALSYSFKPYLEVEGDSTPDHWLSPDRGRLLLMLSRMKIDTGSFQKILFKTSFANADLRNADFTGADLRWAKLHGANLRDANLSGANLYEADLRSAILWGARLNKTILKGAYLTRADLRWTEMNEADLQRADLFGADMSSAQMYKANFKEANLQWTEFNHAFLHEANFEGVYMFRANLKRAQLQNANLRKTGLPWTDLTEANISGADITGINLGNAELNGLIVKEKHWLDLLGAYKVQGANQIRSTYTIEDESTATAFLYRLKKIRN